MPYGDSVILNYIYSTQFNDFILNYLLKDYPYCTNALLFWDWRRKSFATPLLKTCDGGSRSRGYTPIRWRWFDDEDYFESSGRTGKQPEPFKKITKFSKINIFIFSVFFLNIFGGQDTFFGIRRVEHQQQTNIVRAWVCISCSVANITKLQIISNQTSDHYIHCDLHSGLAQHITV